MAAIDREEKNERNTEEFLMMIIDKILSIWLQLFWLILFMISLAVLFFSLSSKRTKGMN